MYCPACGKEILPNAAVCLGCGRSVSKMREKQEDANASAGWWWLGFFVPLAGLILWLIWNDSAPNKAKKAGIGALVGVIVSVALVVLFYIFWFLLMFIGFGLML